MLLPQLNGNPRDAFHWDMAAACCGTPAHSDWQIKGLCHDFVGAGSVSPADNLTGSCGFVLCLLICGSQSVVSVWLCKT